jgi:transcriptional regulator with XRE-family HTH domain
MVEIDTKVRIQNIGRRIGELRARKRLTQAQLAEKLNRSLDMIQVWEKGTNFTVNTLFLLSKVLDCKVEDFFKYPKTKRPKPGHPKALK